jgi:L-lactate dehydrogenase complex protein LldF
MRGFSEFNHLSYACTVCGACTEVCPVKIPLHDLLLLNRKISVERNLGSFKWNNGMKAYEWAFKRRKNIDRVGGKTKNKLSKLNKKLLGSEKIIPVFADQSFSRNWKLNLK